MKASRTRDGEESTAKHSTYCYAFIAYLLICSMILIMIRLIIVIYYIAINHNEHYCCYCPSKLQGLDPFFQTACAETRRGAERGRARLRRRRGDGSGPPGSGPVLPDLTDGIGTPDPNPKHLVNWCF